MPSTLNYMRDASFARADQRVKSRAMNLKKEREEGNRILGSPNLYQRHSAEEISLRKRRYRTFEQAEMLADNYTDDPADLVDSHPDLFSQLFKEIAA